MPARPPADPRTENKLFEVIVLGIFMDLVLRGVRLPEEDAALAASSASSAVEAADESPNGVSLLA